MQIGLLLVGLSFLAGTALSSPAFSQDFGAHVRAGKNLTPQEVASLEADLAEIPGDLYARAALVGYYYSKIWDPEDRARHDEHVLWLIKHAPETNVLARREVRIYRPSMPDGYLRAKATWYSHLEEYPNNLAILEHAANFFQDENRKTAIQLLERAQALDEGNAHWARRLGYLHHLDSRRPNGKRDSAAAKRALAQFELAYGLRDESRRRLILRYLGVTAFNAGSIEKARKYAEQMLQGNAAGTFGSYQIHLGNVILGRIALLEGNLEEAKRLLIAAGEAPGVYLLSLPGPDMTLANELLELGESEVVLRYLSLYSQNWKRGQDKIEAWTAAIKKGETPNFRWDFRF